MCHEVAKCLSVGGKEPKAGDMGGSRDPHIIVIVLDWQTVRSRMRVKLRPTQVDRPAPNRYNQQLIDRSAQEIAPSLTPPRANVHNSAILTSQTAGRNADWLSWNCASRAAETWLFWRVAWRTILVSRRYTLAVSARSTEFLYSRSKLFV